MVSCKVSLYLAAKDAAACGDTDTITVLGLPPSPLCKNTNIYNWSLCVKSKSLLHGSIQVFDSLLSSLHSYMYM